MTAPREWAWLARIRRPQGRKGEVFAQILTDFPGKFAERRKLWLIAEGVPVQSPQTSAGNVPTPREVVLNAHWMHKGGIVLHFDGSNSIGDAEALSGLIVAIPRAERVPLGDDEAYVSDLIGCTVVDVAGTSPVPVGPIEDVDQTSGPVALLVVRGLADEVLIPFAKSYLRRIDLDNRRIEMELPAGLVDLNSPE